MLNRRCAKDPTIAIALMAGVGGERGAFGLRSDAITLAEMTRAADIIRSNERTFGDWQDVLNAIHVTRDSCQRATTARVRGIPTDVIVGDEDVS